MSKKKRLTLLLIAGAVFLLGIFITNNFFLWKKHYFGKIAPGVSLGDLNLGGQTPDQAKKTLQERVKSLENAGLLFQTGDKQARIPTAVSAFDADLSFPTISFDLEKTLETALGNRADRNFFYFLITRLAPRKNREIKASYSLAEDKIKTQLLEAFPGLEIKASNAYFSLDGSWTKNNKLKTNPEKLGKEINYEALFEALRNNLDKLQNNPIIIKTQTKYPELKQEDLAKLEPEAKKIVGQGSLILSFSEEGEASSTKMTWTIRPERLVTWISAQNNRNETSLSLDLEKIKQYLQLNASPEIDQEALRPRFEIQNGKVASWQKGADGRQLDVEENAKNISQNFLKGLREITLIAKEIKSESLNNEEDLNIKEIIGTGHSNFSGSPENRRKNIRVGADAVHGILIKPNEEFSLVRVLGDVSEKTGYFPELVIKGDKTIPEYGGGLCQIGTTVFRTALASGLPITARQNHSYRVSYYEPAGTDAAIYIPNPDVRFLNDTGNYILIQARINKNDLYFDFWGIKDGRVASTTAPTIYNIVKPEPTKLIESADLPLGEKKCTEKAHNGADAFFDYKVIYPEGATTSPIQERRFRSHYVPWQEVCLIGTGLASSTASSTNSNASSTNPSASSTIPNQ